MVSSYIKIKIALLQNGGLFFPDPVSPAPVIEAERAVHPLLGGVSSAIQVILGLAGLIAIIFLIWASFQYTTSQGDQEKVDAATKQMITAIVAVLVIILAFVFLRIIINVFT